MSKKQIEDLERQLAELKEAEQAKKNRARFDEVASRAITVGELIGALEVVPKDTKVFMSDVASFGFVAVTRMRDLWLWYYESVGILTLPYENISYNYDNQCDHLGDGSEEIYDDSRQLT